MNAPFPALDDRIATAIAGDTSSAELASLLTEARAAAERSSRLYSANRMQALDPQTPRQQVAGARQAMADAEFASERLKAALMALDRRHEQALEREEDERRETARAEAVAERDELVAELRREYPSLAGKLADLLSRVRASEQRLRHVGLGQNLTEAEARGAPGNYSSAAGPIPRLTEAVRLPAFGASPLDVPVWPPRQ